MGVHNNVHIPRESWPYWTWLAIEFFIVLAIALVIAWQVSPVFDEMIVGKNMVCVQESHETKCSIADEAALDETNAVWIFWGISGAIFVAWYIVIRGFILKKPILQNR